VALEITPEVSEAESAALRIALTRAGVALEPRPQAYESAWRRAASVEAVENTPALAAPLRAITAEHPRRDERVVQP
jgi:hypothetical protein